MIAVQGVTIDIKASCTNCVKCKDVDASNSKTCYAGNFADKMYVQDQVCKLWKPTTKDVQTWINRKIAGIV